MNHLNYFTTPKENLKINMVYRDEAALAELRRASAEKACMPDVSEYYTDIFFPEAPADRPYTFSSIVLSADGKMAYQDKPAGPLIAKNNYLDPDGSLGDFWVLNILRAYCDADIMGANTLAKEPNVTFTVYDEDLNRQRREVLGKKHPPLTVVASFDGTDIPGDHYAFGVDPAEEYKLSINTSPAGMEYIKKNSPLKHVFWGPFTSREQVDAFDFGEVFCDYDVVPVIVTGEGTTTDSKLLLYILRRLGMMKLLVESPSYCAHMLQNGMLDEYFINYSMVYAGGTTTPGHMTPYGAENHPHANLLSLGMHRSNFMFTRQKLCYNVTEQADLSAYQY